MPTLTPADAVPDVGDPVDALETPVLVVDLDVMDRNLAAYAAFADEQGVRLRSHVKTHKTPALAHRQHELTGGGIVCQTLGEVEVMAAAGLDDIYLSYPLVGGRKPERGVRLAESLGAFATTVDGPGNVDPLQAAAAERGVTVDVVLEVDVGLGRTGVPGGEPAVELAAYVDARPNLELAGVMAYEAHVKGEAETEADYERLCAAAMDEAAATVDAIEDAGVAVGEVKVGGTATSWYSARHPVVDEINPGMYPFNDVGEIEHRPWAVDRSDCAATVLATVVSAPSEDRAVVDAGSKTLSLDKPQLPLERHRDDVAYVAASEEHGWLDATAVDGGLAVGDRLEFVVPHVCTTVNLHDVLVGVRDGHVESVWAVQARGKVR